MRKIFIFFSLLLILALPSNFIYAFAFIFAGTVNGMDVVTHPTGYMGATTTSLTITVGIDPTSVNAAAMAIPTENCVTIFNALSETTGNLTTANVPFAEYDFESVLLHEMGHTLGLAHCNLGSQTGVSGANTDYTNAEEGGDGAFDFGAGTDAVIGTEDDARDDDDNLNWFRTSNNDPFTIDGTVDNTTYSRDLADLPATHTYSANASRDVGTHFGYINSEAVMQQGTFNGEAQRTLGHDDVAGLRMAMSGLDETQGNADDYTFTLSYIGLDASADIVIDFDGTQTGFAVASTGGSFLGGGHVRVTTANIYFHPTVVTWFFNTNILPVELLSFSVEDQEGDAFLQWVTSKETNHDHFEIERSLNARDWQYVESIEPESEVKDGKRFYSFNDPRFGQYAEKVYYRVAFVDTDGGKSYGPIKSLTYNWETHTEISLSHIPFQSKSTLDIWMDHETEVSYQIYGIDGRMVSRNEFTAIRGLNSFGIGRQERLAPGIYVIKVSIGSMTRAIKFLAN